jgi:NTP pyrophosphatase (non-canonical NTP hydrolase)
MGGLYGRFESREDAWTAVARIRDSGEAEAVDGAAVVPLLPGVTPMPMNPRWLSDEAAAAENAGRLTFGAVSAVNRARCERWHPGFPADGWTGADWATAMAGEAGEACNVVKRLRRDDFGRVQAAADSRADLVAKLATEIGDTFLYLDLLAQFYGLDIARCIADTFNRVSVREGFPERIQAQPC